MTATITAEGALSDDVLQAARAVVEQHAKQFEVYPCGNPWAGGGVRNAPLLTLLDQLIGAMEPVADAIADNCWDDCLPIPAAGAKGLAQALNRMADLLTASAAVGDSGVAGWSLPSCTGKELV